MNDELNPRLAKWEIETIDALAQEALEKASRNEFIEHEESFLGRFITKLQTRCLSDARERKRLVTQADRLGIGLVQPPRIEELQTDHYDVASPDISGRWCRIINLVLTVETDHEWRDLHRELVTRPLMGGRMQRGGWHVEDDGLGVLEILEVEAKRHGLMGDEAAPAVDTRDLATRLLETLGRTA